MLSAAPRSVLTITASRLQPFCSFFAIEGMRRNTRDASGRLFAREAVWRKSCDPRDSHHAAPASTGRTP
jgi:hypothetical protein